MGKKSFMEWQYFFGRIPEQVQYWFFQDAVQGVVASLVCAGDDTNGGVNEGSNYVVEVKGMSRLRKGNSCECDQGKAANAARSFYD